MPPKPDEPKYEDRDHYDRAIQQIRLMHNMGASGEFNEQQMLTLTIACALTEGILALTDAMYATKNLVREPTKETTK